MSYHCPRCGFYYCQNQGGTLESALSDWPREAMGLPPIPYVVADDHYVLPW